MLCLKYRKVHLNNATTNSSVTMLHSDDIRWLYFIMTIKTTHFMMVRFPQPILHNPFQDVWENWNVWVLNGWGICILLGFWLGHKTNFKMLTDILYAGEGFLQNWPLSRMACLNIFYTWLKSIKLVPFFFHSRILIVPLN